MSKINLANFKKALGKVNSAQAKAEETKLHITRMCEMQELVDMSDEKIQLLIDTLYSKATDCDKTLLEKGVVDREFHIKAEADELYDYVRIDDINRLDAAAGLERVTIFYPATVSLC